MNQAIDILLDNSLIIFALTLGILTIIYITWFLIMYYRDN